MPPLLLSRLRLFQHPRGLAYSIYVFGSNPLAYVATAWSCYSGRTITQLRVLNIATIFVSQVTSGLCCCCCCLVLLLVHPLHKSITTPLASNFSARIVTRLGLLPSFFISNTSHFLFFVPSGCRRAECLPHEHSSGRKLGVISQPVAWRSQ